MSPLKPGRRLAQLVPWLAVALAIAGLAGVAAAAPRPATVARTPFTLRGAQFSVLDHRLTYQVTICTPAKSVLKLTASFTPEGRARGVTKLTPGTTQYQDRGCWPAFVSAALARSETKHCQPISCPAVIGRRYRASVTVAFSDPHETRRPPALQALA
jgi:hypothetical protein